METAFSWAKYATKAIVGAVVAAGGALGIAMSADSVGGSDILVQEWITVGAATVVAGAVVFMVTNAPSGAQYAAKAIVAGVTALTATLAPALVDGITTQEWITIAGAVLLAVTGVYFARNGEKPGMVEA